MPKNSTSSHAVPSAHHAQPSLSGALDRFRETISGGMRDFVDRIDTDPEMRGFYGQMRYHLGWVDEKLQPADLPPGKLLRPALVLWSCELASDATHADAAQRAKRLRQALPAAVAVELVHNFSLIHDDIEDQDEYRRHRRTLWSIWGAAQGINTGDGMFALARLSLWETLDHGLHAKHAAQIAALLDRTSLRLCEGQHRDMSFEASAHVTTDMYLDTIERKTASLMRAATAIGAQIGAPENATIITNLAEFGEALGIAFQVRDDLLGIWANQNELGKAAAGDLRRKKMSLPIIRALANADPDTQARLLTIYGTTGPATDDEVAEVLAILTTTASQLWCRDALAGYCAIARGALERGAASGGTDVAPVIALGAVLDYVEATARG